jgi:hypothetical protein
MGNGIYENKKEWNRMKWAKMGLYYFTKHYISPGNPRCMLYLSEVLLSVLQREKHTQPRIKRLIFWSYKSMAVKLSLCLFLVVLAKIHGEFLFCFSRTNIMKQFIFTWAQLWKTFTAHSWTCQDFVPTWLPSWNIQQSFFY